MNITIILDSSRLELLGSSGAGIIEKLYLIAVDFNNTLTLEGNIISTNAYGYLVDYLNTNYGPNFIVNATNRYIHFEDPNMESYLASMGIGTDGKVTEAQTAAVTVIANASNSTITKFNELKYFTNITESKGGWSGTNSGNCSFYLWTALEEVDASGTTINVFVPDGSALTKYELGTPTSVRLVDQTHLDYASINVDSSENIDSVYIVNVPNNRSFNTFGKIMNV